MSVSSLSINYERSSQESLNDLSSVISRVSLSVMLGRSFLDPSAATTSFGNG